MISRRMMLAATAAGAAMTATAARAASFGNPDEPPQGAINAKSPASITDPGAKRGHFQPVSLAVSPPPDRCRRHAPYMGIVQQCAAAHPGRRLGASGNPSRFAISKTISGVNMRLGAGGIRELHWHQAAEWAFMTYGNCRVTVLDAMGQPYVADVKKEIFGISRPATPIPCRGWARMDANSSSASMMAMQASSTPCW